MSVAPTPTVCPVYLIGHQQDPLWGWSPGDPPDHFSDILIQCLEKSAVPALRALCGSCCKLPALNRTPEMLPSLPKSPFPKVFCYYLSVPPTNMDFNIFVDEAL